MASSLGPSAVEVCAAARAGISRASEGTLETEDPVSGFPMLLPVHVLAGTTDGFEGPGRLFRLASLALGDVVRSSGLPQAELGKVALILHVAGDFHARAAAAADVSVPLDALRQGAIASGAAETMEAYGRRLENALLKRLVERAKVAPAQARLVRGGPTAFFTALETAAMLLERKEVSTCLVGSVDAPADPSVMSVWESLGMLKTPSYPVGVIAGEAAAFVLLSAEQGTRRAGRDTEKSAVSTQGWLEAWGLGGPGPHRFSRDRPAGRSLHEAMRRAWEAAGRAVDAKVAIANLGGDEYRALELGGAMALQGMAKLPSQFETWLPAMAFGETGAASAAVSVCMAVRAFSRRYARGRDIAVLSMDDDGKSGCCIVMGPEEVSA